MIILLSKKFVETSETRWLFQCVCVRACVCVVLIIKIKSAYNAGRIA